MLTAPSNYLCVTVCNIPMHLSSRLTSSNSLLHRCQFASELLRQEKGYDAP